MKYASNNIRNILIAGHAGSGKTTLTEALVYFSGAAERMGRVEDGTTISDFDPEEAKRKASLSASVVPVEYEGIKYNLIDAPGLFDFEAGEYEVFSKKNLKHTIISFQKVFAKSRSLCFLNYIIRILPC